MPLGASFRTLSRNIPAAGGGFLPSDLTEVKVWYDAHPDYCFQERTGASATTASAVGDPVGTWEDRGAAGIYATAPSDAARPILRQDGSSNYYLEFDGTDDTLDLDDDLDGVTDEYVALSAEQAQGIMISHGTTGSSSPKIGIWQNGSTSTLQAGLSGGTYELDRSSVANRDELYDNLTSSGGGTTHVLSFYGHSSIGAVSNPKIGGQSGFEPEMNLYQMVLCTTGLSTQEQEDIEDYVAGRSGVTLP